MTAGRRARAGTTATAALVLLGLTTAPPAQAATSVVSTCSEAALRQAITTAATGDVLTFGCSGTITVTGAAIVVDKDLTLDGTGHDVVLSGGGTTPLLFATNGSLTDLTDLTLRRLTLADGWAGASQGGAGGAITSVARLVVEDVVFRGNGAIAGGAIASRGVPASLTVRRSTFEGNRASGPDNAGFGGGAIALDAGGPTLVEDSTFRDNYAGGQGSGGALVAMRDFGAKTGAVTITRSTFERNTADPTFGSRFFGELEGGGAIMVHNRALTISDSTFVGNTATSTSLLPRGGAVLVQNMGYPHDFAARPASITGSTFTGNTATRRTLPVDSSGGAVAATVPLVVERSTFSGNTAGSGGALSLVADATVRDSTVSGNTATRPEQAAGGGLWSVATTTVSGSTVSGNLQADCGRAGSGDVVDGGGNVEGAAGTCGFGRPPLPTTTTALTLLDPVTPTVTTRVQNTDRLDLLAVVSRSDLGPVQGLTVDFTLDGQRLGEATTDHLGQARLEDVQMFAPGWTGTVSAGVRATDTVRGSSTSSALDFRPEDLLIGPVQPGTAPPGDVDVSARVAEVEDGAPNQVPLFGAGAVQVVATPQSGSAADARHCSATTLVDESQGGERAGCRLLDLRPGTYSVRISSLGHWYTGSSTGVLVVTDPGVPTSVAGQGRLAGPAATFRLDAPVTDKGVRGSFEMQAGRLQVRATITVAPRGMGSTAVVQAEGTVGKDRCTFRIEVVDVGAPTRTRADALGLRTTCGSTVSTDPALTFTPRPLAGGDLVISLPRLKR